MKAKEFIEQNQDILTRKMTEADFHNLRDGTVLFCISVANGNKPPLERTVRTVGYQMVVATTRNAVVSLDRLEEVLTLALTTNGYAKLDYISPTDIAETGTKLLYECKPLSCDDPRKNHHWRY